MTNAVKKIKPTQTPPLWGDGVWVTSHRIGDSFFASSGETPERSLERFWEQVKKNAPAVYHEQHFAYHP